MRDSSLSPVQSMGALLLRQVRCQSQLLALPRDLILCALTIRESLFLSPSHGLSSILI